MNINVLHYPENLHKISGGNFVRLKPSLLKIEPDSENTKVDVKQNNYALDNELDEKFVLYLPINVVEDTVSNDWSGVENMRLLVGDEAGMSSLAKYIGHLAMNNADALINFGKDKLVGRIFSDESKLGAFFDKASVPKEVIMALRHSLLGGAGVNPHEMMVYNGVERRTVNLSYDKLIPSNEGEDKMLKLIIGVLNRASKGSYGDYALIAPPMWDVDFYSLPRSVQAQFDNNEMVIESSDFEPFFGLKKCIINNFSCKHGGSGEKFMKMETGTPIKEFTLSLMESEPMAFVKRDGGKFDDLKDLLGEFSQWYGKTFEG